MYINSVYINPAHHTPVDNLERVDVNLLYKVVNGVERVLHSLASSRQAD